jgi:hypothetical protein
MNSQGGAQKFIIKNNDLLIQKYLDSLKYSTSITNLSTKLRPILTRDFQFHIHGILDEMSGKKNEFSRFMFPRQKYYQENPPKINYKNQNDIIIIFHFNNLSISQHLHLDNFQISSINEQISNKTQRGGQGYTVSVGQNPVGGKPVISGYFDCCRPVFLGSLMQGGQKKNNSKKNTKKETKKETKSGKSQKGGKANSGYYLDLKSNHLVVQPQYRAYYNTLLPYSPK